MLVIVGNGDNGGMKGCTLNQVLGSVSIYDDTRVYKVLIMPVKWQGNSQRGSNMDRCLVALTSELLSSNKNTNCPNI